MRHVLSLSHKSMERKEYAAVLLPMMRLNNIDSFKVRLLSILTLIFLSVTSLYGARKTFTLVIDAGHGGHDVGCQGAYANEKSINLSIAMALGNLVSQKCKDVKVIYTRKSDVFISLQGRCDVANSNNADLFISIHTNSVPVGGPLVRGTETYYYGAPVIGQPTNDEDAGDGTTTSMSMIAEANRKESELLARYIQNEYIKSGRASRGVKQARYFVLVNTHMPAILTEVGFITAMDEESYMTSNNGINEISQDIFNAFLKYKRQSNRQSALNRARRVSDKAVGKQIPQTVTANNSSKGKNQNDDDNRPVDRQPEPARVQRNTNKNISNPTRNTNASSTTDDDIDAGDLDDRKPVFCIQLFATSQKLEDGDSRFKGLAPVGCFQENNFYKYIFFSSNNYNAVLKMKRKITDKFADAFIIAFKKNERMDVNAAIREYLKNKGK